MQDKIKQSKSLSQIFLKDKSILEKIFRHLEIDNEFVCEIGAGQGNLSEFIIKKAKYLYCVELDKRYVDYLKEKFINFDNVKIINKDILQISFKYFPQKIVVVGNIPYHISSKLMEHLVLNRYYIKRAYLTLQREFVHKLIAKPQSKDYSFMSCYIQFYASVEKFFDISPKSFYPAPKVYSSFVCIDFEGGINRGVSVDEKELFSLIREVFRERRKKIKNILPYPYNMTIKKLGIEESLRPDDILLQDYIRIVNYGREVYSKKN